MSENPTKQIAAAMFCELSKLGLRPGVSMGSFSATRLLSSRVPSLSLKFIPNNAGELVAVERALARGFNLFVCGLAVAALGVSMPIAFPLLLSGPWTAADSLWTLLLLSSGLVCVIVSWQSRSIWRSITVSHGSVSIAWWKGKTQIYSRSFARNSVSCIKCEIELRVMRGPPPRLHGLLLVVADQTVTLAMLNSQKELNEYAQRVERDLGVGVFDSVVKIRAPGTESSLCRW